MAKVIYQYFKKEIDQNKILVRIDPTTMEGLELLVADSGQIKKNNRQFDEEIYEDLKEDEFVEASPMEFNLYLSGITK
ncbi:MAG: hypothetical protein KDC79_07140 [Cyclobacteriaceae bacterium]|nr:hypothetical protein [Cyclobacteriaceae bacterium]